ncbi:hypothetical protein LTR37_003031 [Vermiconidia calcicola]|uniref:Uncharacterized protein n=1 Tax=Vermiconidia calcicola TaxID=1690605 RepID=A0ACC3NSH3_9PEZI|nr:hypothetical protein LTR37_003031 [Vermiconidia calcicola]
MSQLQPPSDQPTANNTVQYAKLLHNTALFALVACPALALLPPRKLDFFTFGLGGTTLFSANYLLREQTGRSIPQHLRLGKAQAVSSSIPDPAISQTGQLEIQREIQKTRQENKTSNDSRLIGPVTGEIQHQREAWKVQHEKEIKDDVEEGKSFADMITEQVWEVWNWGKPKDAEEED